MYFGEEIVAQRAADAPVGQFDQRLVGETELGPAGPDKVCVDIHLGHVIDNYGGPQARAIVQDMVQQGRLSSAKKAGNHRYWKPFISRHLIQTVS